MARRTLSTCHPQGHHSSSPALLENIFELRNCQDPQEFINRQKMVEGFEQFKMLGDEEDLLKAIK